jgi:hypothetical protein
MSGATCGTGGVANHDTYFELSLRVMLGWRGMLCLCDAITEFRLVRLVLQSSQTRTRTQRSAAPYNLDDNSDTSQYVQSPTPRNVLNEISSDELSI